PPGRTYRAVVLIQAGLFQKGTDLVAHIEIIGVDRALVIMCYWHLPSQNLTPPSFSGFLSELGFTYGAPDCWLFDCSRSECHFNHSCGASKVSPPCLVSRGRMRHMTGVVMPTPEMTA